MVGFGSSLRMGRRTGWESAYLDYETLKLLLSQIEAVYEERDLGTGASADGFFVNIGSSAGTESERNVGEPNNKNSNNLATDYRDELFLESDSDIAFASEVNVDDDDDDDSDDYDDRDFDPDRVLMDDSFDYNFAGLTVWEQQGLGQHHVHVDPFQSRKIPSGSEPISHPQQHRVQQTPAAFSVSAYGTTRSNELYSSSSEESDRYYAPPWSNKKKKKERSSKKPVALISNIIGSTKKKKKLSHHHRQKTNSNSIPDAFIVQKGSSGGDFGDDSNHEDKNYYYYNFDGSDSGGGGESNWTTIGGLLAGGVEEHQKGLNVGRGIEEATPLLKDDKPSTPTRSGNFVSFPTPTPRRGENNSNTMGGSSEGYGSLFRRSNPSTPSKAPGATTNQSTLNDETTGYHKQDERKRRYERERRRARKQRRRRRLLRKRREREKKVPPHIRIAHEKSRAIAERFLGLLRAEVEKVTLFAQARLGELADNAGSLRFLSSDETMENSALIPDTYDYPLSDGGIHPSASSSSDEGAGGYHNPSSNGGFPWSDSSSEDDGGSKSSGGQRLNIGKTFSSSDGYGQRKDSRGKPLTEPLRPPATFATSKPTTGGRWTQGRARFVETQEKFEATKRKIAQFQEVRRERSIFQRNEYIVGEDLFLIPAVDEADAFSAVGVELLHILKYICVNLIAVRKICKKHDRLLMNRMLGGYYHRKRTTRSQGDTTLGGLIAHVAGDIYEAHPDLIGLVNNGKLIGIYDLKIQQLANSRTVKVVSSCLALALSEYEISRWRADALAKLNPALKKGRKPLSGNNDNGNNKWLFTIRTDNCLKNSPQQHEEALALLEEHDIYAMSDDERRGGPPSTTSSLSLSRLRYAVLSIAALREASRIKSNHFSNYLSRSSLAFTGHAVIGEGLDGCSRETLDFLLAYNPDAALLLDTCAIYEGLRCGQWRKASIASVMTSALAVSLTLPQSGQSTVPLTVSPEAIYEKEIIVSNALSILPPKSEGLVQRSPLEGTGLPPSIFLRISRFTDVPSFVLRANRISLFLYTANYFIAHPTSVTFVLDSNDNIAYSALITGAPVLAAIYISMLHCWILSGYTGKKVPTIENINLFRYLLMFSCFNGILGNVVQLKGIKRRSIGLLVLGRFLFGFSAAEIVNRQFVVCFLPTSLIVAESARLIHFQVSGQIVGLMVGSLAGSLVSTASELTTKGQLPEIEVQRNLGNRHLTLNSTYTIYASSSTESSFLGGSLSSFQSGNQTFTTNFPIAGTDQIPANTTYSDNVNSLDSLSLTDTRISDIGRLSAANLVMMILWLMYLLYVMFGWGQVEKTFDMTGETSGEGNGDSVGNAKDEASSSESSASDQETGHARLFHNSSKLRELSGEGNYSENKRSILPQSPNNSHEGIGIRNPKRRRFRQIRTFSKNIRKLMKYSIAIPVSLVLILCSAFAQEVLLSSCALISKLYFQWPGSATGLFLGSLSLLILPMDYCCELVTRRYEERFLVKRSIFLLGLGLLVIVNWGSLFALIPNVKNLFKEDVSNRHHQYDWMLGVGQYVVGFIITFSALRALSIGSRSLLSKVSPPNLQNVVVNSGTITTFITLLSQLLADFYIASIVLSQREINIDILNSLLMPIAIGIFIMYYLTRKHFFFLM